MEFLKTDGRIIVNESGEEVILKGFGAGNWMNQEGFLFGSNVFAPDFSEFSRAEKMDRGRSINQTITELCGGVYADKFWKKWYRNYFAKADIEDMAEKGFNSVRLPLNARVLLKEEPGYFYDQETFEILDQVIDWCEESRIYAILDMHAAVTGQSGLLCDDSVDNIPHMFTDENKEGWERTIVLWERLAERYKGRAVVAGYELLNEPLALPRWNDYLPRLVEFYHETGERIRKVDQKHILFMQGHRFASRLDIFKEDMDPIAHNWVLTMHTYGVMPDLKHVGPILEVSEKLNVPVWMGETGGEPKWMATFYEMLYENHIGVNVWVQKAVSGAEAAAMYTFERPEGLEKVVEYAHRGGEKPGFEESVKIFDAMLENVKLENCELHKERVDAILRQPGVEVPAIGYDMLPGAGKSFKGNYPYSLFCGYRRGDHMHLVYENGFIPYEGGEFEFLGMGVTPKYGDWTHLELMLEEEDFACYTLRNINKDTEVMIECCAKQENKLEVTIRGEKSLITIPAGQEMQVVRAGIVTAGEDTAIKVKCSRGNVILRTVSFI